MDADDDFIAFWGRERERLRRALALSLGDTSLATEAVDEAMTRTYQRWDRVARLDDPPAWVYRVASNWAMSWLRKRRLRPTLPIEILDRPAEDHLPDRSTAAAVGTLPIAQRCVVVLRFYLDWPIGRIAVALDVPEGTVKSRLHRALQALREHEEVTP